MHITPVSSRYRTLPPRCHHAFSIRRGGCNSRTEVPHVAYDPFKVDIFVLGAVLKRHILHNFSNVEMLVPIADRMTLTDPALRPTAAEALREWKTVRRSEKELEKDIILYTRNRDCTQGGT
ncbi:hypothetical protein C8Q78DRAFT_1064157 [Trametes maxima]|nr:hypothetical protein C8Q78DRAFT_1064157 [Trametes maxima]